jgi:hypothetical protein
VGFLTWMEGTDFADWVRMSAAGYPLMITCHAIGMGIMVGLAVALDLRLLGWFQGISYKSLHRFLGVAWVGFGINFLSGVGLFAAQATMYATDVTFLIKIGFVFLGAITAALLQSAVGRDWANWGATVPSSVRTIAIASIVCWTIAITAGRLTAYI